MLTFLMYYVIGSWVIGFFMSGFDIAVTLLSPIFMPLVIRDVLQKL
jgi:hypothetical protein